MKVLLINPPIREQLPPYAFPQGLAYVASALLEEGYAVEALDINGNRYDRETVIQMIGESDLNVAGIGGLITQYSYVKWLANVIRRYHPEAKIMIGGGLASSAYNTLLQKTEADVTVIGEGELTVKETVNALGHNGDLKDIKGICYKQGAQIVVNRPREPITDLSTLPLPAWHLFPMETYMVNLGEILLAKTKRFKKLQKKSTDGKVRAMTVSATRGCPYDCNYCYHTFYGYKVRQRPVGSIMEEIKILIEKYRVQHINFCDDILPINKKWVLEFCDRLRTLNVTWDASARVNLVDEGILENMKSAGCILIGYGFESGSQKILDLMNKRATVEQAKKAWALTRKSGITCHTTFMIGYPGETMHTIRETVDFCKELGIAASFFYTTPYPGTQLYEWAKRAGKTTDEEQYFERLSIIGDAKKLAVNLTDFTDEQLIELKRKAELETRRSPRHLFQRALYWATQYNFKELSRLGFNLTSETMRDYSAKLRRHFD